MIADVAHLYVHAPFTWEVQYNKKGREEEYERRVLKRERERIKQFRK